MTVTPMTGRPAREGRVVGAVIPASLKKLALERGEGSTQTARLEAVIARGLKEERRLGPLPAVRIHDSDKEGVKANLPPSLWEQFDNGMGKTQRLVTLLYHGLGLHRNKAHDLMSVG